MNVYYKIDPREERLPKWAQDQLKGLRASVRQMQRALEQDTSDSDTFLQCSHPIQDEALGKGARILFRTGASSWNNEFSVHVEESLLMISATSRVSVSPSAANRLEIRMVE